MSDDDWTPVEPGAVLRIVCKHHHDETLVEHCINSDGTEFWQRNRRGLTTENIAPLLDADAERDVLELFGGGLPMVAPAEGDVPHQRYRFRCPKPSCNYDVQLRWSTETEPRDVVIRGRAATGTKLVDDYYTARAHRVLRLMLAAGVTEWTWDDVAAPQWDLFTDLGASD